MLPFEGHSPISVQAIGVGDRIDIKALERTEPLATSPLTIRAGDQGAAVLFRYGVAVLFNLSPVEEASFLEHLASLVTLPRDNPENERAEIRIDQNAREQAVDGIIWMKELDVERLQIIADVMARSVTLAESEASVASVFDTIEPLAHALQRGAARSRQANELLRHIGGTLIIQHKMVGRVRVEESPELLWEFPHLERLYRRLFEEYELRERHSALERKLALISRTAETLLGLLHHRSSMRVEWYIVILIVAEILIMVGEILFLK
ncbi:MAG TPA: RMD1 family protein [Polyangiaceae bacterium]|jgi:uncharacterized Rmd1/YagE family protein|nr:RMD1 family protein [Polyangiaceae bacterium]HNZ25425.1 RMD1 family protein [Polyangiaceae bacterium]HOD25241.1 RMD1 family protein [Polyangiaceae bacterium]HOE51413.1 RMD1 family protein [Polyangiaceae bacterium]HOH03657.1 RMD1 family protein [Polyangiaceae bacterium]